MAKFQELIIKDFAEVKGGKRLPKGNFVQDEPTNHPYIRVTDFEKDKLSVDNIKYITNDVFDKIKRYIITDKDVYISIAGTIGLVGIIPKCLNNANLTENAAKICNINDSIIKHKYLMYYLRSINGHYEIQSKVVGTSQPKLALYRIEEIKIKAPNIINQEKIAKILSNYDDLIENNNKRIKILEEMAQKIYKEWFVDFKFPGHETTTFKDSELGKIPSDWEVKRICELGVTITGKTPSKKDDSNYGKDIHFIKTPDMHNGIFCIDTTEKLSIKGANTQKNKFIPLNSICVSCIGTVGVVAITTKNCQTNQQINSIIPKKDFYREYLYLICKNLKNTLENLGANGATMTNVNKNKFDSIVLIKPNDKLIQNFSQISKPIFEQIKNLSLKNQTLKQTRDILLPRLISGEIDVENMEVI